MPLFFRIRRTLAYNSGFVFRSTTRAAPDSSRGNYHYSRSRGAQMCGSPVRRVEINGRSDQCSWRDLEPLYNGWRAEGPRLSSVPLNENYRRSAAATSHEYASLSGLCRLSMEAVLLLGTMVVPLLLWILLLCCNRTLLAAQSGTSVSRPYLMRYSARTRITVIY